MQEILLLKRSNVDEVGYVASVLTGYRGNPLSRGYSSDPMYVTDGHTHRENMNLE